MTRILLFGNSGSGKTTLARRLSRQLGLAHLDLDTLAWLPGLPPRRHSLVDSEKRIRDFTALANQWVIEGCYSDLLQLLSCEADEMVYLGLSEEDCVAHARSRPFEPEKYSSEAAQNKNLDMLIDWIRSYPHRTDSCSLIAHKQLFSSFPGKKIKLVTSGEVDNWSPG